MKEPIDQKKDESSHVPVVVQSGKRRPVLLIFIIGILSAVLGLMYIQMQHLVENCMVQLSSLKESQRSSNVAWHDAFDALQQSGAAQQSKTQSIVQQMNRALSQAPLSAEDWRLFNARYYLELAHIQSGWRNDQTTTLALLNAAEGALMNTKQAGLTPIREALSQEIAAVKTEAPSTLMPTFNQLQALLRDVPTLSFSPATTTDKDATTPQSHWDKAQGLLKQLIVVKYHENTHDNVQTPMQQTLLREMITMNLKIATWALIQENQAVFDNALQDIATLLGSQEKNDAVSHFLTALQTLQTAKVNQATSSKSHALQLLQDLLESRQTQPSGVQHE